MLQKQRSTRLEADENGRVLVSAARSYADLTVQRLLSANNRAAKNQLRLLDTRYGGIMLCSGKQNNCFD